MSKYVDRFKMASCPFEARWFFVSKRDRKVPFGFVEPKIERKYATDTGLQRNGRQSPKSDDDINDSCVKTRRRTYFLVSPTATNGFEMCRVLNANPGL